MSEFCAGDHRVPLAHDGLERTCLLHVPPGVVPFPLVVMLHGAGGSAEFAAAETGWTGFQPVRSDSCVGDAFCGPDRLETCPKGPPSRPSRRTDWKPVPRDLAHVHFLPKRRTFGLDKYVYKNILKLSVGARRSITIACLIRQHDRRPCFASVAEMRKIRKRRSGIQFRREMSQIVTNWTRPTKVAFCSLVPFNRRRLLR